MLIRALTDEFERYSDRAEHHDTVLWFDAEGEYAALLEHLTKVPLWRYESSLLQIRHRLIHRVPGERAVVYLPMRQEDAETLRPFFATSLLFKDRLYRSCATRALAFRTIRR